MKQAQKSNIISIEDGSIPEVPYNELAEQMLLAALITNNENYNKISDFLSSEHFYIPLHKKIFESIETMNERGMVANIVTLRNYFNKDNNPNFDSLEYLNKIASLGTNIINVYDYGQIILDLALRRKLIVVGEEIVNNAKTEDIKITANDCLESAEHDLFLLSDYGRVGQGGFLQLKDNLVSSLQKIESAFKHRDSVTGISTGFKDLDEILGGFHDSDLVILAGRPSMGKTAVTVNLGLNACKHLIKKHEEEIKKDTSGNSNKSIPPSVGIFSLEMSGDQLASRLISMISGISTSSLRSGHISKEDFAKVINANKELYNLPLFIDDTPALSISAIRTRARRLKRKHNLRLLIIDYLQLLKGSSRYSEGNRVQEVSEITQGLKAIAKELNIPVIALSQLSRAVESREDKRPLLSDLRESGSIEQDADIVMFIYRDDYYLLRRRPKEDTPEHEKWQLEMDKVMNISELIIAKQRNGPVGNVKIHFDAKTTTFSNLVEDR